MVTDKEFFELAFQGEVSWIFSKGIFTTEALEEAAPTFLMSSFMSSGEGFVLALILVCLKGDFFHSNVSSCGSKKIQ